MTTVRPGPARGSVLLAAIVAVVGTACGDDDAMVADASTDAGIVVPPRVDAQPPALEIPWLDAGAPPVVAPVLTPCPAGWREISPEDPGGVATCDPYPASGALDCAIGEAHFPGGASCEPVGSRCPAGDFADGLADDGSVIFVRAGATGGDGTRAAPFGLVSDAMAAAVPGTTIALAKGRYVENVRIAAGVTLSGACAAETVLSPDATIYTLTVRDPGARLRDLSIDAEGGVGVLVNGSAADLDAEGLVVANGSEGILVFLGSSLVAREVVVRDMIAVGGAGAAVSVQGRSDATIERAVLERSQGAAVLVSEGTLSLSRALIRDPRPGDVDGSGPALVVGTGGTSAVVHSVIERSLHVGLYVDGAGSTLTVTGSVVRDTLANPIDGSAAGGLFVGNGASAVVSGSLFDRNLQAALVVVEPGTSLVLTDSVVRGSIGAPELPSVARGVALETGSLEMSRVLLEDNDGVGVSASERGATLVASDLTVRRTRAETSRPVLWGQGVHVQAGASAEITRVIADANHTWGMTATSAGTHLVLTDALIRGTLPSADGIWGRGLQVDEATAEVTRAVIEDNREIGAVVGLAGGALSLTDVWVRDTQRRECAETTCAEYPAGMGVGSYLEAALTMTRFAITGSGLCGVHIARDGSVDLALGLVADNPVGVCLQVEGYDVDRLTGGVVYRDNGTVIEATSWDVPEPIPAEL